jgi:hypothetical protein
MLPEHSQRTEQEERITETGIHRERTHGEVDKCLINTFAHIPLS